MESLLEPFGAPFWHPLETFGIPCGIFWDPFWEPLGSLLGPSGTLWDPFGTLGTPPGPGTSNSPSDIDSQLLLYVWARLALFFATEHRSAAKTVPHFTPRHRFATFALRLGPFGSVFRDGAPVCSENGAFRHRDGDLNFRNGAPVCSENGASFRRDSDPNGNHRFAAKHVS